MRPIPFQMLANNRGVALLSALFAVIIISYLAVEISYEAGIEYRLAKNRIDELKAHYAAKAGAEISLLRISMYKQASAQFGDQVSDPKILDMIWNMPLSWPPAVGDDASLATKEEIDSILQDTMQDSIWITQIQTESSKIDINDLNSPVESLRTAIRDKLVTMLSNRLNQEDAWAERNSNLNVDEVINNIVDWIDPDTTSSNGGEESRFYTDIIPEGSDVELPPNRDFKTVEELHMVAGITDDIYDVIAPQITVYGAKGINVNYAEKDMVRAIDLQITEPIADEIIKRRNDPDQGPFQDLEDFESFIKGLGVDTNNYNEHKIPLRFKKEFNFKITSTGSFGKRTKEIIIIAYDLANAKAEMTKLLEEQLKAKTEEDEDSPNTPQTPSPVAKPPSKGTPENKKESYDKGRPKILYWKES